MGYLAWLIILFVLQMEKTEKTMAELEVERNASFEFDKITEAGAELKPMSGKG